jgi:hypothetical protein
MVQYSHCTSRWVHFFFKCSPMNFTTTSSQQSSQGSDLYSQAFKCSSRAPRMPFHKHPRDLYVQYTLKRHTSFLPAKSGTNFPCGIACKLRQHSHWSHTSIALTNYIRQAYVWEMIGISKVQSMHTTAVVLWTRPQPSTINTVRLVLLRTKMVGGLGPGLQDKIHESKISIYVHTYIHWNDYRIRLLKTHLIKGYTAFGTCLIR